MIKMSKEIYNKINSIKKIVVKIDVNWYKSLKS